MPQTRVAVVQAGSVFFDLAASLAKCETLAHEARSAGARVVVFPEAFLSGYPRGMSFGTVVGNRTAEGRDHYRRYWDSAVDVPGPAVDRLTHLAVETGLYLVVGVIEREGGTLYCTALFFGPEGFLGKHRKLMPTAAERVVWGSGDGSTLFVVDTPFGRVGSLICWESYMPLLRAAMYAKGVEILCVPTADGRESWLPTMRFVGMEGRCFVLSCNQLTRRQDLPDDIPNSVADLPEDLVSTGGSCIIGPLGDVLAGPAWNDEQILYADIDTADISRAKLDFDAAGHYARPDVFHLEVDETPRRPVTFRGGGTPNE
jgi:nitrilase